MNQVRMSGARTGGGHSESSVVGYGASDPVSQQLVRRETAQTADDHGDDEDAEFLERWPARVWRNRWHGEHDGVW